MKSFSIVICVLIVCLVYSSCDSEDKGCSNCRSGDGLPHFKKKYLRIYGLPRRLYSLDTLSGLMTQYHICNADQLQHVDDRKILLCNGTIEAACDSSNTQFIAIDDFHIVHFCLPSIPTVPGEFNLSSRWYLHSIRRGDTTFFHPCESMDLGGYVSFEPDQFRGTAAINSFTGTYELHGEKITIRRIFVGLYAGTRAEAIYENIFFNVFSEGRELMYIISGNTMELINAETDTSIKLYTK